MDLLLDYGDLGAIVKAGFSSPDPSVAPFTSIAAHASPRFGIDQKAMGLPASGAAFSGFCVPLFSSSELPGVSNAFGLLPSPTPLQYPVRRGPVFASSGGPSQTLRMPASSSLESLYSKTLDAYDSSSAVCPSPTATQHSLTPESAYAPPNTMALGQHEDRFITICQKILAANDPLAATRSVLNSMHTPSSAAGTGTPAAPVIVPSSIPSIFLRPLQMQPATSPLPNIPNDGGDKRSAETELACRSAPASSNSNRARPTKRRKLQQKRVVQVPAIGAISSKPSAGETVPSDMWAWRKYGQKPIKGSPHPRGYYKCSSSKGCPARKQVERNPKEPSMLVVTYTSEHNHPWPTNRINALAGSTRKSSSSSTTTAMHELSPICSSEPSSLDAASHHSPASIAVDDCVCASPLSVHDDPGTPGPQDGPAAKSNTPSSTGIAHGDLGGVKMDEVISRVSDWQMDAKLVPSSSSLESMWLGGQEATVAEDSEGQLLDNLLSEMLEKVQRQNKGNEDMAMKMMGQEDDDDDDELFFNWSNSFNFCSQVNHVVQ